MDAKPKRKATSLTKILVNEISIVDAGANKGARVVLCKRAGNRAGEPSLEPPMADKTLDEIEKAARAAQEENDRLKAENDKLKAEQTTLAKRLDDVEKAQRETAEKAAAELQKRLDDAEKRNADLATAVSEMRAERDLGQHVAKAKAAYPNLPLTAEELAPALQAVAKLDEGPRGLIEKILVAANEAMAKVAAAAPYLGEAVVAKGAEAQFNGLVEKYASEHNVTKAKATAEVAKTAEGGRLYAEMEREQKRVRAA